VSIGRLSGVGALWDCVPRVCDGGGGCAGGGVPLGAVPALSWCGEVSLGGKHIIIGYPTLARSVYALWPGPLQFISVNSRIIVLGLTRAGFEGTRRGF